ncbi:hypothetical protein LPH50_04740 [Xylella taiwanensis]|uniref:Uncharacterized protein n=3 Tax=Xylella taiwanensis TaxID=1444770 RepID=A0ABS8TRI7_9GAMM|nr:hypothetical protein [Xylella taiwanensis]AXI84405.1 hypothetical protein AB672_10930 [Xylella taiwanensis]MCD8455285.1 hypothetical protein [Xylella taiwanensis]MCD8457692.1 hypothetical protein [Xylella taiwanensis]MCD8459829.1 hypothetical protein [Xylella taiwanensis]MCD8464110.1 hypothetical protein [Xylella taiwanensis]
MTGTLQHRRRYCRANITPRLDTAKRLSPVDVSTLWKDFRQRWRAAGQRRIRSQSRVAPLRGAHQSGVR